MHLHSFTGPLVESLPMLIITSYLLFISFSPGIHCKDRVFNIYSSTFMFSYIMSFFTSSNQITNFIKSGPVPMLPEEKYGGHIILLVCNMTTMGFKVFFVILMNGWMNDSNIHIDNEWWHIGTELTFRNKKLSMFWHIYYRVSWSELDFLRQPAVNLNVPKI